jgi:hypothetical protein
MGAGGTTGTASSTTGTVMCDNSGGGVVIEPTFETFKTIIRYSNPTCAASDCHGNNEANPLDLTIDDELMMNLLNTTSEACGNVPVVDPGNPEGSALVMLLKGPCGELERMPRNCNNAEDCNCVPDNYIAAVEQWIAMGAPEQ